MINWLIYAPLWQLWLVSALGVVGCVLGVWVATKKNREARKKMDSSKT